MDVFEARLVTLFADDPQVPTVAAALAARHREPQRRYHTAEHVAEMLDALALLSPAVPPAVVCAVLWHDAVYDPTASDNEERSAVLARGELAELGAPAALVDETVRLVLLTSAHDPAPGDDDGALLSDADLAILAAPPERYRRYAAAVRAEYAHVGDEDFRRGRVRVLRALAAGGVYRTEVGRTWEPAARRNLEAELAALAAPG